MLKKLILISGFVFSSLVFAGENIVKEKNIDSMNLYELKEVRKNLRQKLDDYEFDYHYTLTHNRIQYKIINYKIDKQANPDNANKVLSAKSKVNDAFVNINKKTEFIYKTKRKMVNSNIKAVNGLIKSKTKREFN